MGSRLRSTADAAKWHLIFTLLSLDAAAPFWKEMGLELRQSATLRELSRSFVRQYRAIQGRVAADTTSHLEAWQEQFQESMDRIEETMSAEVARAIEDWGSSTFRYGDELDGQAFMWRRLLRRLAGISNLAFPCGPMELSDEKTQMLAEIVRRHLDRPEDTEERIAEAERRAKSAWDESVFGTYTGGSPMDWVASTIGFVKTRAVWREIEGALDREEIAALLDWARRQAVAMEMPAETIEQAKFV